MKHIFLVVLSIFFAFPIWACDCADLEKMDVQVASKYNAIARIKIDKLGDCKDGKMMVFFDVLDLYKGTIEKQDWLWADCSTQCSFNFEGNEEWIVYLKKNNAQELLLNFCSHSRKLIPDDLEDYQTELVGLSYTEEKQFLENNFDVNAYYSGGIKPRSYKKISMETTVLLVVVGLVTMLIALWLSKRFFKNK